MTRLPFESPLDYREIESCMVETERHCVEKNLLLEQEMQIGQDRGVAVQSCLPSVRQSCKGVGEDRIRVGVTFRAMCSGYAEGTAPGV